MKNEPKRARIMAHVLRESRPDVEWRELLREAWSFNRFRRALRDHVVKFTFRKKDGTIRQAIGTTNFFFVPEGQMPIRPHKEQAKSSYTITYFDLEKQEWRCFDIRNWIGKEAMWPEVETAKEKRSKRENHSDGE